MQSMTPVRLLVSLCLLLTAACHSIPGSSTEEKRAYVDEWEQETLEMLYEEHPEAEALVENSAGYLLVGQKLTKVPLIGAGGGFGVLVDRERDRRVYVKLSRIDLGGGWGVRSTRVVVIIDDPKILDDGGRSRWNFGVGAEAAAKAGEAGAAGGGGTSSGKEGLTSYELTEAGVSATVTVYSMRLSAYSSLN